jgi:hypothetical protein
LLHIQLKKVKELGEKIKELESLQKKDSSTIKKQ